MPEQACPDSRQRIPDPHTTSAIQISPWRHPIHCVHFPGLPRDILTNARIAYNTPESLTKNPILNHYLKACVTSIESAKFFDET